MHANISNPVPGGVRGNFSGLHRKKDPGMETQSNIPTPPLVWASVGGIFQLVENPMNTFPNPNLKRIISNLSLLYGNFVGQTMTTSWCLQLPPYFFLASGPKFKHFEKKWLGGRRMVSLGSKVLFRPSPAQSGSEQPSPPDPTGGHLTTQWAL